MSIWIQRIEVSKLGPLDNFQAKLGRVNLIYGQNEAGKTYLVEFLLQSLFRNSRNWALRDSTRDGEIEVHGLAEDPIIFSPSSHRKLEDYWETSDSGLPHNMARLLIVKGGELALAAGSPGGVNREILKNSLTSQALLDEIWHSIQPTVRKAEIDQGQILGNNMGKIKEHNQLRQELANTQKLLDNIEENYTQGPVRQIELELDRLNIQLDQQNSAKRHLGYVYREKIKELVSQESSLNKETINKQRDQIRDYQRQRNELEDLKERIKESEILCQDLPWLEAALDTWEEKGLSDTKPPRIVWGLSGAFSLAAGISLLIIDSFLDIERLIWLGSSFSIVGFGVILFYGIRLLGWSRILDESREREQIRKQFQQKFGKPLKSIADLKEIRRELQKHQISSEATRDLIDNMLNQLAIQKQVINGTFNQLTNEIVEERYWVKTIQALNDQKKEISTEKTDLELKLGKLNLTDDQLQEEPADLAYNPELVENILDKKRNLENELQLQVNQLDSLKARAAERTGSDITLLWIEIYYQLRNKHLQLKNEYQLLTAQIMAEIGLTAVLTRLRDEEDQKINQALNTQEVSTLIKKITGTYSKLELDNNQLYVHDGASRFSLHNLSTGAREQIQLGLRLGFAARINSGNPLFLILDDAFQHSDWQRREALVESTLELGNSGWQILYLTMDDHIRDLFTRKAQSVFNDDYQLIEIN
jgi:energy-coupling factor transporter ATP-binding protein EcfA2